MNTLSRRSALALGLASLSGCLGFTNSGGSSESFERTFAAAEVATLQVTNPVGGVSVVADDVDEVRVRVVKRARGEQLDLEDIDVAIDLEDGDLDIETTLPEPAPPRFENASVKITVTVPAGDTGPDVQSLVSLVGDISLSGTRGDTVVRGDVGNISASDVDGYLSLSGRVGELTASSVTGLDRATTEVGDVKVDLLGVREDVEVGTDVGSVVVGVNEALELDVLAESGSRVDSELQLEQAESSRKRVSGKLNGGGHRLHVFSDVGDVALRSLSPA